MNKEEINNLINNIELDFNCIDIKLIDILNKYNNLKVIENLNPEEINNLSNLINRRRLVANLSWIKKYNNLINAMNDIRNAPNFMELNLSITRPFFKLIYDKYDYPIILITKLHINEVGEVFSFKIYGLYGEATRTKDINSKINYIQLSGINRTIFNTLDISTIEVNKYFRQNRGSEIIKYLETELIDGFNRNLHNKDRLLTRIEGTIGTLSGYYVSNEDRIRFYIKNGFTVIGRRFYKNINKEEIFHKII